MTCPICGAIAPEGVRFCERDGTPLATLNTIDKNGFGNCRCGAGPDAIDENGFCTECGIRRSLRLRDHFEIDLGSGFAAVTDRGIRHSENQDDVAAASVDSFGVIVVCDGVSGSEGAADASDAAAKTACAAIESGLRDDPATDLEALLMDAVAKANDAVLGLDYLKGTPKDPPETTLVAAVLHNRTATIAWVGDSRAYWFDAAAEGQLIRDHSWVNAVVDAGEMTEEEALQSKLAHAIVRCLGGVQADNFEKPQPSITTFELPEGATLLLCSDGLWNYAASAQEIAGLARAQDDENALAKCRRLIDFAISQGGRDNITVALYTG